MQYIYICHNQCLDYIPGLGDGHQSIFDIYLPTTIPKPIQTMIPMTIIGAFCRCSHLMCILYTYIYIYIYIYIHIYIYIYEHGMCVCIHMIYMSYMYNIGPFAA